MAGRRSRDRHGRPLPAGRPDELAAEEPAEVALSPEDAARRALVLFEAERFFEAHEFFEHVWKSPGTAPADRAFWKAVTQLAVACCHRERGNPAGARKVYDKAARILARYPSPHLGVDTAALRRRFLDADPGGAPGQRD